MGEYCRAGAVRVCEGMRRHARRSLQMLDHRLVVVAGGAWMAPHKMVHHGLTSQGQWGLVARQYKYVYIYIVIYNIVCIHTSIYIYIYILICVYIYREIHDQGGPGDQPQPVVLSFPGCLDGLLFGTFVNFGLTDACPIPSSI